MNSANIVWVALSFLLSLRAFLCSVFGFVLVNRASTSLTNKKNNLDHEVARALLVNDVCKLVVKINEQCRRCMGSALFLLLLRATLSACEVAFGFVLLSRV